MKSENYPRDLEEISLELHTLSDTLNLLSRFTVVDKTAFSKHFDPPSADVVQNVVYNAGLALERISRELDEVVLTPAPKTATAAEILQALKTLQNEDT